MVRVRNTGGDDVAHDLGIIEVKFATICASHEDAARGIHRAASGTARAQLEIARVLLQERREHGGRHQGADSGVGEERAIAPRVALETLPIRRITVPSLSDHAIVPMKEMQIGSDIVFAESLNLVFAESGPN